MLVSQDRKTGREVVLVPELCWMTGLSPALLSDFKAAREIRQITHSDAPVKVKECLKLFSSLTENRECKNLMESMKMEFVQEPIKISAYKLDAGKMLMGKDERDKRIAHDIETCGRDLDRRV